ncbi:hypothetical protein EXS62_01380 [Candidatus Kaiserbacteria bacterium]|nr:hypothetical protein [Candidatus Kaiserbacteria bacterium]
MNLLLPDLLSSVAPPALLEVPKSLCLTPDKNRTWAAFFGLSAMDGHSKGREVAETVIQAAFDAGTDDVAVWMMSASNKGKRPTFEQDHLKNLLKEAIRSREEKKDEVGFYVCGPLHVFRDPELDDLVARAHERNSPTFRKRLTVLCAYRGISDFKQAAARVCEEMGPEAVENEDMIRRFMWIKHLPPQIDMFLRTGVDPQNRHNSDSLLPLHGEQAFVYDTPVWWPDFTVAHLYEAFRCFGESKRPRGA